MQATGTLYIVGTPIGNMEDMSIRAIETLQQVALIAAEDTRRTGLLKKRFGIEVPLTALHEHNEKQKAAELVARLSQGEDMALVTDAGMPVVSDPGAVFIAAAREANVPVTVIPGPSAVTTLLSVSGFRGERFRFEGFLPRKLGALKRHLENLKEETAPIVCFESPFRLVKTLQSIETVLGDVPMVVGRELTKLHEDITAGTVHDVLDYYTHKTPKGEITFVFLIR